MTQWAVALPVLNPITAQYDGLELNQNYADQDGLIGIPEALSSLEMMHWVDKLNGNVTPSVFINDNSHIKSPSNSGDHILVCKLSTQTIYPLAAPPSGTTTGFILSLRMRKDLSTGGQVNGLIELRQDYLNESTQGTLICQIQQADVTPTFTDFTHTLTSDEIALITDYGNLYVRVVGSSL